MSILNFFTEESVNNDGGITMFERLDGSHKSLYLTNRHGFKLLKIGIKNEPVASGQQYFAQIKLIPYGIKRVYVWRDQLNDPLIASLRNGLDLTYHGNVGTDQTSKVHIKSKTGHTTLIDEVHALPVDANLPLPLFSVETGFFNQWDTGEAVTKNMVTVRADHEKSVRFDLYLAGSGIDEKAFINSAYFFNFLWSQDYLIKSKGSPLQGGKIIAPILSMRMRDYILYVRRSLSSYSGRPCLHLYQNRDFYEKFMNRRTAYSSADGSLTWADRLR